MTVANESAVLRGPSGDIWTQLSDVKNVISKGQESFFQAAKSAEGKLAMIERHVQGRVIDPSTNKAVTESKGEVARVSAAMQFLKTSEEKGLQVASRDLEFRKKMQSYSIKGKMVSSAQIATAEILEALEVHQVPKQNTLGRPVAVAQLVMLGYSIGEADNALNAVGKVDVALAVKYLGGGSIPSYEQVRARAPAPQPETSSFSHPAPVPVVHKAPQTAKPKAAQKTDFAAVAMVSKSLGKRVQMNRRAGKRCSNIIISLLKNPQFTDRGTLVRCLQAMWHLCVVKGLHAARFLKADGMKAIVGVLSRFGKDREVQLQGCVLVHELLTNASVIKIVHQLPEVARGEVLTAVSQALLLHPDDALIVENTAACIWAMCFRQKRLQNRAMDQGVVSGLLRGLAEHKEAYGVQYRASGALLSLAIDNQEAMNTLAEQGVREAVRNALVENPRVGFAGAFEDLRMWMRPTLAGSSGTGTTSAAGTGSESAPPTGSAPDSSAGAYARSSLLTEEAPRGAPRGVASPSPQGVQGQPRSSQPVGGVQEEPEDRGKSDQHSEYSAVGTSAMSASDFGSHTTAGNSVFPVPPREAEVADELSNAMKALSQGSLKAGGRQNAIGGISKLVANGKGKEVIEAGALKSVLKIMNNNLQESSLQASACVFINMVARSPSCKASLVELAEVTDGRTCAAISAAMRQHSNNGEVQRQGCTALWGIANLSTEMQLVLCDEGVVELLIATAQAHPREEQVASAAAGALLAIAKGNPNTQTMMASKGAPGAVKKVFGNHKTINFKGEFDDLRTWLREASRAVKAKK